ncbi:MAG TPA: SYNERG-CTERM sorting domain-containing protein [Candidatus Caccocola faecipullorum]|nr:SYNERG-CTERM sorting domain-containing protein [Candidatus Caccocola faecipullorum]
MSNCIWLDSTAEKGIGSGSGDATSINDISSVVTWLSLSQSAVEVGINKAAEIDLILKPAMSASGGTAPDGAFGDARAVRADEVGPLSISDGNIASAEYAGGKITVTGKSIGETTLTMQVKLHPTDFSSLTNETPEYENDDTIDFTFSLPVRVVAEAQSGGSSSGSGSSGGGGGGCSAGFGALALLAAVPLFFRRKK